MYSSHEETFSGNAMEFSNGSDVAGDVKRQLTRQKMNRVSAPSLKFTGYFPKNMRVTKVPRYSDLDVTEADPEGSKFWWFVESEEPIADLNEFKWWIREYLPLIFGCSIELDKFDVLQSVEDEAGIKDRLKRRVRGITSSGVHPSVQVSLRLDGQMDLTYLKKSLRIPDKLWHEICFCQQDSQAYYLDHLSPRIMMDITKRLLASALSIFNFISELIHSPPPQSLVSLCRKYPHDTKIKRQAEGIRTHLKSLLLNLTPQTLFYDLNPKVYTETLGSRAMFQASKAAANIAATSQDPPLRVPPIPFPTEPEQDSAASGDTTYLERATGKEQDVDSKRWISHAGSFPFMIGSSGLVIKCDALAPNFSEILERTGEEPSKYTAPSKPQGVVVEELANFYRTCQRLEGFSGPNRQHWDIITDSQRPANSVMYSTYLGIPGRNFQIMHEDDIDISMCADARQAMSLIKSVRAKRLELERRERNLRLWSLERMRRLHGILDDEKLTEMKFLRRKRSIDWLARN